MLSYVRAARDLNPSGMTEAFTGKGSGEIEVEKGGFRGTDEGLACAQNEALRFVIYSHDRH